MENEKKTGILLPALRLAAALLLLLAGAYLAVPSRGLTATLPFFVFLAFGAAFLFENTPVLLASAFLSGLLFGTALEIESDRLLRGAAFGLFLLLSALLALSAARLFRKKKPLSAVFAVLCLAAGVGLHFFWNGTPWLNAAQAEKANAYLAEKYPTQEFTYSTTWFDRKTGVYRTEVGFPDGEIEQSALIDWDSAPRDGYFALIADRVFSRTRSELIAILRSYDGAWSVDPVALSADAADLSPVRSLPDGILEEEFTPWLIVSVELKNQNKKRDFDQAAAKVFSLVKENGLSFAELIVRGTAGDTDRFEVTLRPDTDPDSISSISRSLQKELPLQSS